MAVNYAETAFKEGYEFTQGTGYALPEYPFVEPPEIRKGEVSHHPIVIVGGGLAGLTMACALALSTSLPNGLHPSSMAETRMPEVPSSRYSTNR